MSEVSTTVIQCLEVVSAGSTASDVVVLEAAAAQNAEIAAQFIRQGNRRSARQHLHRAIEQLNEAEIED